MKKISKNIILMITMLSLIGLFGNLNKNPNEMHGDYDEKQTTIENKSMIPNSAASHAPIFIDGNDPANYWDDCDAVSGSGTVEDPYVIEDLEIDAGGSGSGIYIRDSTAYLNIVSCTAINAGSNSDDAGLRIYNCQNINISNCSFTNSSNLGILLTNSHYNTLTGNMATNTLTDAIRLYGSDNNTLTGNMGTSITHSGIRIWFSDNNKLTGNTAAFNPYMGIYFSFSSYNTLTGNTAVNNTGNGIHLDGSYFTTITGNTVASNSNHGIRLYRSDHNNLTNNMVTNNSVNGIRLDSSSEDNDISYNIIHTNPTGIYIDSTSSASIFENWIWDNVDYDIYENGGEAKSDYADNYYTEYEPLSDTNSNDEGDDILPYTGFPNFFVGLLKVGIGAAAGIIVIIIVGFIKRLK